MQKPTVQRSTRDRTIVTFEFAHQEIWGVSNYSDQRLVCDVAQAVLATRYPESHPEVYAGAGYYSIFVRYQLPEGWAGTDADAVAWVTSPPESEGMGLAVTEAGVEVKARIADRARADSAHSLCLQVVSHVMQEARDACRAEQRLAALKAEVESEYTIRMRDLKPVAELVDPESDIDPSVLALTQAKLPLYDRPPTLPTGGIPGSPKHYISEEDARAFRIPTS